MDTAKPEMSSEKCSHYSKESVEKRRRPTCGQFFCKGCLRSCSNKNVEGNFSKDRLKCPSCGAINEMPDGLVDNLDSNDSTVVYKSSSTQEICVSCKNLGTSEKAVKFCRHCVDSFCQKCSIIFHSVEVFKHHEFVEIDYTLESVREIYLLREKSNLLKCSSHPTKKIKFHCLDHDRLCCSNCAFSNHRTCSKVVEIAKIPRNKNDTQDIKQKVSKISNDASDVIAQLTDTAEKTKTQESSVSEHLRQIRGNINNIFKNLEFKCTETAKLLTTRETQIIYKEIRKIQSLLDSLAVYASMLDKDDVDGSGCDHYIAKRKCLELLEIIKPTLMDLTQNSKIHTIACVYGTLLYDILNLDPNDTRKLVSIQECN